MQCTGLQYSSTVHQISLKRIISYKSSLTDALICLPWWSLEDGTTLLFILFLWIKFLNKRAEWRLNNLDSRLTRLRFCFIAHQITGGIRFHSVLLGRIIDCTNTYLQDQASKEVGHWDNKPLYTRKQKGLYQNKFIHLFHSISPYRLFISESFHLFEPITNFLGLLRSVYA